MAIKKVIEKKTGEKYTSKGAKAKHERTESKAEMKKEYGKPKPPIKQMAGAKGLVSKAVEAVKAKKTATTPAPKMKKC